MEKSVLVVDDEERVVQSIAGVLEDEGLRVTTAMTGEEAIDLFQKEKPDITLLDIWLPGMDGMEVLKRMRPISPECLVIMISGHATISTAMAAVKFGAFDFIEKPLSLDFLLLTIRRALDRQKELSGTPATEGIDASEIFPAGRGHAPKEIPEGFVETVAGPSREAPSHHRLQRTGQG